MEIYDRRFKKKGLEKTFYLVSIYIIIYANHEM